MKKSTMYKRNHMTAKVTAHEVTSHNLQHAPSTRQENQVGVVEKERWDEEEDRKGKRIDKDFGINVRTMRRRCDCWVSGK